MNVLLTLNAGQGLSLGKNFTLSANSGTVVPNTATLQELLNGKTVVAADAATSIIITSIGECTNSLTLNI